MRYLKMYEKGRAWLLRIVERNKGALDLLMVSCFVGNPAYAFFAALRAGGDAEIPMWAVWAWFAWGLLLFALSVFFVLAKVEEAGRYKEMYYLAIQEGQQMFNLLTGIAEAQSRGEQVKLNMSVKRERLH